MVMAACPVRSYHPIKNRNDGHKQDASLFRGKLEETPYSEQCEQDSPDTTHQCVLVKQEEPTVDC